MEYLSAPKIKYENAVYRKVNDFCKEERNVSYPFAIGIHVIT